MQRLHYVITVMVLAFAIVGGLLYFGLPDTNAQVGGEGPAGSNPEQTNAVNPVAAKLLPTRTADEAPDNVLAASEPEQPVLPSDTTDISAILAVVTEFANRQEAALFGRNGWLHLQSTIYIPPEQRGNGYHLASGEVLAMEEVVPAAPLFETWYHVDATGTYHQAMGLVSATDGTIQQQTVFVNGRWVNLTLDYAQAAHNSQGATAKATLPAREILHQLESMSTWRNVSMEATWVDGQYTVIAEQLYEEPIADAVFMPEPVTGIRVTHVFDSATGQPLTWETQALLESGAVLLTERGTYLTAEFVPELPVEVAQQLDAALNKLQEDD